MPLSNCVPSMCMLHQFPLGTHNEVSISGHVGGIVGGSRVGFWVGMIWHGFGWCCPFNHPTFGHLVACFCGGLEALMVVKMCRISIGKESLSKGWKWVVVLIWHGWLIGGIDVIGHSICHGCSIHWQALSSSAYFV